jgi:hypothetical protein
MIKAIDPDHTKAAGEVRFYETNVLITAYPNGAGFFF